MIHIRTWSVRKKVHYKAVKSKTKVGGEFQKMRDKFHCKLSKKLKKKELKTDEQKKAFVESFDWWKMTAQDEKVWEKIYDFLDK